jgi:hypothetical protein
LAKRGFLRFISFGNHPESRQKTLHLGEEAKIPCLGNCTQTTPSKAANTSHGAVWVCLVSGKFLIFFHQNDLKRMFLYQVFVKSPDFLVVFLQTFQSFFTNFTKTLLKPI